MKNVSLQKLDLNLLKVFSAIVEERNLTRAAERLHLTPSATSHALKRLRDVFDDSLFERQGHTMVPNSACLRLATLVNQTLRQLESMLSDWESFEPATHEMTLVLALRESLELSMLPKLLSLLEQRAPQVALSCVALDRNKIAAQLARREVHFAIDVARPVDEMVAHSAMESDEFCVLGWDELFPNQPLTSDGYFAANHIAVSSRARGATVEDIAFAGFASKRHIVMRCQSYLSAANAVCLVKGLLTIPRTLAKEVRGSLSIHDLPMQVSPLDNQLYWGKTALHDPVMQWLKEIITDSWRAQF